MGRFGGQLSDSPLAFSRGGTGVIDSNNWTAGDIPRYDTSKSMFTPSQYLAIPDGVATPNATSNQGKIYIDSADGDLKIIFGDGTIKTIITDS